MPKRIRASNRVLIVSLYMYVRQLALPPAPPPPRPRIPTCVRYMSGMLLVTPIISRSALASSIVCKVL